MGISVMVLFKQQTEFKEKMYQGNLQACRACIILFLVVLHLSILTAQENAAGPSSEDSSSAIPLGFLHVKMNLDKAYLVADGDFNEARSITNMSTVRLSAGKHTIVLVHPKSVDRDFKVQIGTDSLTEYTICFDTTVDAGSLHHWSSYSRILFGANAVIVSDDDADIFVDGKLRGKGTLKTDLSKGTHLLKSIQSQAGETEKKVEVVFKSVSVFEMYNKPDRHTLWWLSVLPGAGQLYKDEKTKGYLLLGSTVGSLLTTYLSQQQYRRDNRVYESLLAQYNAATNEASATRLGNDTQAQHNIIRRDIWIRNGSLIASAVLWAFSLVDALGEPESGYRITRDVYPFKTTSLDPGRGGASFTFNIVFRTD